MAYSIKGAVMTDDVEITKRLTAEKIAEFVHDDILNNKISQEFCRIKTRSVHKIIEKILKRDLITTININLSSTNINDNKGKFLDDGNIKEAFRSYLEGVIEKHISLTEEDIEPEAEGDNYVLNRDTSYDKFEVELSEIASAHNFVYNFNIPDMEIDVPKNINTLQRCRIQISSPMEKYDYPVLFKYRCTMCNTITEKKVYEVRSTKNKISCKGWVPTSSGKGKICNTQLSDSGVFSKTIVAYFYQFNYDDIAGENHSGTGISMKKLPQEEIDCVMFKINNPLGKDFFHIVDYRVEQTDEVVLPEQTEENYLITLQKFFDKRIVEKTGKEIWGMNPIKIALIIQAIIQRLGFDLNANMQLAGQPSSGKSLVLETYGNLLYGSRYKKTKSKGLSIARLQGTREKAMLFNKEIPYVSRGMLGEFSNIYIDEAGENKELIENLKSYLQDSDYSYSKTGSNNISPTRTAHINIAGNIDSDFIESYVNDIIRKYEFLPKIPGHTKLPWDGTKNLFLPLPRYTDPYVYLVIKNKRNVLKQKDKYWMDGFDEALHQRFLFYFNIDNSKENDDLNTVVDKNCVKHNIPSLNLLYSHSIEKYFRELKEFSLIEDSPEKFKELKKYFKLLGLESVVARTKIFWNIILKISRIANKRREIISDDYKLVAWLMEATTRQLDILDTNKYELTPMEELENEKKILAERESDTKNIIDINDSIGLPEDEFPDRKSYQKSL